MNIQWFPGHMTKARRMMAENLKLVDAVCEVVDARIPYSSRNPDLDEMTGGKPRLIILNRVDQADPELTKQWALKLRDGAAIIETDSQSGRGVSGFPAALRILLADRVAHYEAKGQVGRKLRVMVAGVPNVGKSSLINRLAGGKPTKVEDRPGVTRGSQWVRAGSLEVLDMPGVLWPKFEDPAVGECLALTGAVKDDVLDIEALALRLLERLLADYPQLLSARYRFDFAEIEGFDSYELLKLIGRKRGMLIPGGEIDTERAAIMLLDEYRAGTIGRITLELPM